MIAKIPVTGNTKLVNYGIQTEDSDLRAHVCVASGKVYVYKTEDGAQLVKRLPPSRLRQTWSNGYVTAEGYPVKPNEIKSCSCVDIPELVWSHINFSRNDNPTVKGQKAIAVVRWMMNRGCFPLLPLNVEEVDDTALQVKGQDIIVALSINVKVQVKCDYDGGEGGKYGTLYLQVRECNPFGFN